MHTITDLAKLLNINEFEVFERAYVHWYGQNPELTKLEQDFGQYITGRRNMPVYVKNYLHRQYVLVA